ncbi:MAG: YajQ family cyclic di-GMP-binding protein [Coxiellaceae bacterium]|nr:MAG: YajQ family cyclic di-GMP-binding protein [Coxiellaceae bacterium]
MPSFDIVSEVDMHEITNAVDQANRELSTRFDFKGTNANFKLNKDTVTLTAPNDFQLKQMLEIIQLKLTKRGIDIRCLEIKSPQTSLHEASQEIKIKQGIDQTNAKQISKIIKDNNLKVQTSIQGDKLRVTGKKRDDLQETIAFLRAQELALPLQFNNYRD